MLLYDDILFVGAYFGDDYSSFKTARTNRYAIDFFRERFPHKRIVPIELRKHDREPAKSVLHLDCAFQPVSRGRALIYREGFLYERDVTLVEEIFGRDNLFGVTPEEAYYMSTNVVSLSPDALISDRHFTRLNAHLREAWGDDRRRGALSGDLEDGWPPALLDDAAHPRLSIRSTALLPHPSTYRQKRPPPRHSSKRGAPGRRRF